MYVALLRGINIGGNNKIRMKKLRATFESLGFQDVQTYINSGNVLFTGGGTNQKTIAGKIESGIKKDFGLTVRVLLRNAGAIRTLCEEIPVKWKNDDEQRTDVLFLWDEFDDKKTLGLIAHNPAVDTLRYIAGAIVWNIRRVDFSKSGMKKFIGTEIYKNMTARNINTVRKLDELTKSFSALRKPNR